MPNPWIGEARDDPRGAPGEAPGSSAPCGPAGASAILPAGLVVLSRATILITRHLTADPVPSGQRGGVGVEARETGTHGGRAARSAGLAPSARGQEPPRHPRPESRERVARLVATFHGSPASIPRRSSTGRICPGCRPEGPAGKTADPDERQGEGWFHDRTWILRRGPRAGRTGGTAWRPASSCLLLSGPVSA
jgi:hypothetical protein